MIVETVETRGVAETERLGARLAERLGRGDLVALIGELGAGKTALVRGLAAGVGADADLVSSPTYVLVQQYPGPTPLFHVDVYRLSEPAAELGELGIEEMLADGIVAIEWADRAGEALPRPYWRVEIEPTGESTRRFRVARVG